MAAASIRTASPRSSGGSQLPFRSSLCCSSSVLSGSSPSLLVGSARSVVRTNLGTFLSAYEKTAYNQPVKRKPNSRTSVTLSNWSGRTQKVRTTSTCSLATRVASFISVAVFNWLSGYKSCRSGSVSPVLLSTHQLSSVSLAWRKILSVGSLA